MQKIFFVLFSVVICSPWYQNLGNDWDDQMIDRSTHEKKVNNINKKGIRIRISKVSKESQFCRIIFEFKFRLATKYCLEYSKV